MSYAVIITAREIALDLVQRRHGSAPSEVSFFGNALDFVFLTRSRVSVAKNSPTLTIRGVLKIPFKNQKKNFIIIIVVELVGDRVRVWVSL